MKTRAREINAFNYRSSLECWEMIFVSYVTKKDIDHGPVRASTWDLFIIQTSLDSGGCQVRNMWRKITSNIRLSSKGSQQGSLHDLWVQQNA